MFIYICECVGLRNIVIMVYLYITMFYLINDLNLNLNLKIEEKKSWIQVPVVLTGNYKKKSSHTFPFR